MIKSTFALISIAVLLFAAPARAVRLDHLLGLSPADHVKIDSEATRRPYHMRADALALFSHLNDQKNKPWQLIPRISTAQPMRRTLSKSIERP